MIKNTKKKGSRNEYKSIRLLEAQGYRCCRSAASLGEWDVIGVGVVDVVLVQVKSNDWPRTAEMTRLASFKVPPGVRRVVHRWRDHARQPDIRELA